MNDPALIIHRECSHFTGVLFVLFLLADIVKTTDHYGKRNDVFNQSASRGNVLTTRHGRTFTNRKAKESYDLEDSTIHLLNFGAALRMEIVNIFGNLVYEHYDDYNIVQVEALYKVYDETLKRNYNIFSIVPSIIESGSIKPSTVCEYIHNNVHTCLKESSQMCMKLQRRNEVYSSNLQQNLMKFVYQEIQKNHYYPRGFSLSAVLRHLKKGSLQMSLHLVAALLLHIKYNNFGNDIRISERELVAFFNKPFLSKHYSLLSKEEIQRCRNMGVLLKMSLKKLAPQLHTPMRYQAEFLSEHTTREVDAISKNIEHFGIIYENNTINLEYLFDLIFPNDIVDDDIAEAKEYLLKQLVKQDIVDKYLWIDKFQQSAPDQLMMDILSQLKDFDFAVDIVKALLTIARFWHRNQMIKDLDSLIGLTDAYENLRDFERYEDFITNLDEIKSRLRDANNVKVELNCNNARACLVRGLRIVSECESVDLLIRGKISKVLSQVSPKGGPLSQCIPVTQYPRDAFFPSLTRKKFGTSGTIPTEPESTTILSRKAAEVPKFETPTTPQPSNQTSAPDTVKSEETANATNHSITTETASVSDDSLPKNTRSVCDMFGNCEFVMDIDTTTKTSAFVESTKTSLPSRRAQSGSTEAPVAKNCSETGTTPKPVFGGNNVLNEDLDDCEGDACKSKIKCEGTNCSTPKPYEQESKPLEEKKCVGEHCAENTRKQCAGINCDNKPRHLQELPAPIPILCDNPDPDYRKKQRRLENMRQMGIMYPDEYVDEDSEFAGNPIMTQFRRFMAADREPNLKQMTLENAKKIFLAAMEQPDFSRPFEGPKNSQRRSMGLNDGYENPANGFPADESYFNPNPAQLNNSRRSIQDVYYDPSEIDEFS